MFNFLYKVISLVCFKKPSVQYIAPKTLNLYFANAKNPQLKMINLTQIISLDFEVVSVKNENDNSFALRMIYNGNKEHAIEIAQFETRVEAEDALRVVRVKLFSPEKKMVKFIALLLFLLAAFTVFMDLQKSLSYVLNGAPAQRTSAVAPGAAPTAPVLSDDELKKLYDQAQAMTGATPSTPAAPPPTTTVTEPATPGNKLLESLK